MPIPLIVQQIIVSVLLTLASAMLAPKPPAPKPPGVDQLELPTADEGGPIPVIFGRVRMSQMNVVAAYGPRTRDVKTKTGK